MPANTRSVNVEAAGSHFSTLPSQTYTSEHLYQNFSRDLTNTSTCQIICAYLMERGLEEFYVHYGWHRMIYQSPETKIAKLVMASSEGITLYQSMQRGFGGRLDDIPLPKYEGWDLPPFWVPSLKVVLPKKSSGKAVEETKLTEKASLLYKALWNLGNYCPFLVIIEQEGLVGLKSPRRVYRQSQPREDAFQLIDASSKSTMTDWASGCALSAEDWWNARYEATAFMTHGTKPLEMYSPRTQRPRVTTKVSWWIHVSKLLHVLSEPGPSAQTRSGGTQSPQPPESVSESESGASVEVPFQDSISGDADSLDGFSEPVFSDDDDDTLVPDDSISMVGRR